MTYDLVVAGGGPAGLGAARAAAEAGASVLVLERESAFGIPTRTSGASFVASLQALGIPSRLWSPISEVRFLGPSSRAVFAFETPVVCVLDVRALYQWLAEQAAAAGAELRLRSTVAGAADDGAGVTLTVRSAGGGTTVRARWCVDATGTAAVVSGAVGMHPAYVRRGVGAEVDLAAPAFPSDRLVLAVGERLAPAGYAWAFPWREGRVRLGVGVMRPDSRVDPRDLLEAARRLPGLDGWLEGAQPVEVHAGLIPAEPLRTRIHRSRVVCAGDSASHASTLAGEGIRYALAAGAGAGAAVAAALRTGTDRPVRDHERSWRRRHGRDFAIAYRLNTVLAGFDDRRWDRAVATLARTPAWFAAAALSTDFSPRLLLRLAAGHPRLALTLLRAAR